MYWKPLVVRLTSLFDPYSFNGDALQHIAPFWNSYDKTLLVNDYIISYYETAILPFLFRWFYGILMLVTYPPHASKFVTLTMSVAFIYLSTLTAYRLAGKVVASTTLFLAFGGVLKNFYFLGGIQRGFGFCLTSAGLLFTVQGNAVGLALLAVIAMPLYPAASILLYAALSLLLVVCPKQYRGEASSWPPVKRIFLLGATGIICALMAVPQLRGGMQYGERLSLSAETEYAEWGGNGRYTQGDRGVPTGFFQDVLKVTTANILAERISGHRQKSVEEKQTLGAYLGLSPKQQRITILLLTAILGLLALRYNKGALSQPTARLLLFILAVGATYGIATITFPLIYIPSRYTTIGITALIPIVFPAVWFHGALALSRTFLPFARKTIGALTCALLVVFLGWTNLPAQPVPSASGSLPLFSFIRSLPKDSVIAAWPRGIANMIPLFSARSVLVYEEGHQIFHRDYLEEMRRRTRAIIEAFSAVDEKPFQHLRSKYRVTHVLIDKRHLSKTPSYFSPFREEIRSARKNMDTDTLFLRTLVEKGLVFHFGNLILIDLDRAGISPSGENA
jgi:hypothetical protein